MIFPRALAALCTLAAGVALLAGCTSSGSTTAPTRSAFVPSTATATTTTGTTSSPPVVAPVTNGKLTEQKAATCPLVTKNFVYLTVGMRLDRITVLRIDGAAAGCRFYPLSHPNAQCDATCLRNEHLPGPNQPAVEILTQRYPTAVAAHNAFVRAADQGTNPQQHQLSNAVTTVCYQTTFDPSDHGRDWACGFSTGTTTVLVRVAQTTPALNTVLVTQKVLGAL